MRENKIYAKKTLKQCQKRKIFEFLFSVKVAYQWSLYGKKIAKIEEVKNLTLGHLKALWPLE